LFSIKTEQFSNERKQSREEETLSLEPPNTIPTVSNNYLVHVDDFAGSNNVGNGYIQVNAHNSRRRFMFTLLSLYFKT